MISIIIPVYNQADKLLKTLDSLSRQTQQDFEVIIVNDGSKDGVEAIFSSYAKKLETDNYYVFLNQSNKGAPTARNRGFKEAKGEYILFCDADAVLVPKALELMLSNLYYNPTVSYVYSSFRWGRKMFKLGPFDPEKLKKAPCIHTMSLIRASDFPAAGWDEKIKKLQDWDLWLTMLSEGKIGLWIPEVLFTVSPGGHISSWLPAFAYRLFPFLPAVQNYRKAMKIVKEKHGI